MPPDPSNMRPDPPNLRPALLNVKYEFKLYFTGGLINLHVFQKNPINPIYHPLSKIPGHWPAGATSYLPVWKRSATQATHLLDCVSLSAVGNHACSLLHNQIGVMLTISVDHTPYHILYSYYIKGNKITVFFSMDMTDIVGNWESENNVV